MAKRAEEKESNNSMHGIEIRGATSRHDARRIALQILYAVELTKDNPTATFDRLVKGGDKRHRGFARELVLLTTKHIKEMDAMIESKSRHWDLSRMALMDHLLLRLALSELFYIEDVPPKVTINEAIEVAKDFSTDQSGRFINGLLDALYEENEPRIRKVKNVSEASPQDPPPAKE